MGGKRKMYWTRKEFLEKKERFLTSCEPHHGGLMFWHLWLMCTVTWLSGWGISALLKAQGMLNMPARYAISFSLSPESVSGFPARSIFV